MTFLYLLQEGRKFGSTSLEFALDFFQRNISKLETGRLKVRFEPVFNPNLYFVYNYIMDRLFSVLCNLLFQLRSGVPSTV